MLIVQVMAWEHLVNGDRPQRRDIEIAQMFELPLTRPARIRVGEVIHRTRCPRLKWPWRPHARKRPAEKLGRRRHFHTRRFGQRDDRVALEKRSQLAELLTCGRQELSRLWMRLLLGPSPRFDRIAAVQAAGDGAELLLRRTQLSLGNREQTVDRQRDALVESELLLEPLFPEPERCRRAWANVVLEILDVAANRLHRFDRGIGEIAKQMQVVDRGK